MGEDRVAAVMCESPQGVGAAVSERGLEVVDVAHERRHRVSQGALYVKWGTDAHARSDHARDEGAVDGDA